MKKTIMTTVIALILVLGVTLGLCACVKIPAVSPSRVPGAADRLVRGSATATQKTFAMTAASSAGMLDRMAGKGSAHASAAGAAPAADDRILTVNRYLGIIETLVTDGGVSADAVESDNPDYAKKLVITVNGLAGNSETMTLYYNETGKVADVDPDNKTEDHAGSEAPDDSADENPAYTGDTTDSADENPADTGDVAEPADPADPEDPDDPEDAADADAAPAASVEDFGEIESSIEGILVKGEGDAAVTYIVKGRREIEHDSEESKNGMELKAYLGAVADGNYIRIKQEFTEETDDETGEVENGEEYKYEVYENGSCVTKFEVEIEFEAGETEIEVKSHDAGRNLRMEFEREKKKGADVIDCEIFESGKEPLSVEITVRIVKDPDTGEEKEVRSYRFDGKTEELDEDQEDD